jgi:ABC-type multidrug transport system fused ATPase/permease subunit
MSLSAIVDAQNAIGRIRGVFDAELLEEIKVVDPALDCAIAVEHADFTWDGPPPEDKKPQAKAAGVRARFRALRARRASRSGTATPETPGADAQEDGPAEDKVFHMRDVNMRIPRGQLVAVVGQVGAGKTSLLEGLIGEMRRTAGSVTFGGSVGYCPQAAWIQNATVRDNITFGRAFEEARYWAAVEAACLGPDLDMLPFGDMTEVGEKGISLSGGQKQRLNICRAIYCAADIQVRSCRPEADQGR